MTTKTQVAPLIEDDSLKIFLPRETNAKMLLEQVVDELNLSHGPPTINGIAKQTIMEIIWKDDIESLEYIYDNVSDTVRKDFAICTVVNEDLPAERNLDFSAEFLRNCYFRSLPVLAAVFQAKAIFRFFCRVFNTSVLETKDVESTNVIHALILGSYLEIKDEEHYVNLYQDIMAMYPDPKDRMLLLHAETADGFRPLELATRLGQYHLLNEIVETSGVYRILERQTGPFREIHYSLPEYYSDGERYNLSPLHELLNISSEQMGKLCQMKFLEIPLFKAWEKKVFQWNRWKFWSWFFYRIFFVSFAFANSGGSTRLFYMLEYALVTGDLRGEIYKNSGNSTESLRQTFEGIPSLNNSVEILMCLVPILVKPWDASIALIYLFNNLCFVTLLVDFYDIAILFINKRKQARINKKFRRGDYKIVCNMFYRLATFMMALGYLLFFSFGNGLAAGLFTNQTLFRSLATVGVLGYGFAKVFTTWSLLYFLQVNRSMGMFIIGFQRMLLAMLQFLCIFSLIFMSFSNTFLDILSHDCTKHGFRGTAEAMYSTFLMILNMVPLMSYDTEVRYLVQILHAGFIIIVTILLVNFLIALMSSKHTEMTEYGDVIFRLYRLSVFMSIENRLARVMRLISRCCKKRENVGDCDIVVTLIKP